ncbi:hypothetical protein WJX75_000393 [Coccomyxa subellipsoidea]|uniref:Uncharacterized protein n=1 Tax=Coccomyxa subellipsoidea TaxID=248742 RepID=A0ABR2YR31_9CHLO
MTYYCSRTGQTINEFGATRFDVAVRALRGDFDPPQDVENTERCDNILIGALKQFPLTYTFNVVLKGGQDPEEMKRFVSDTLMSVSGSSYHECQLSERLNGKYVSVKVSACMQSPDMIASVFQELGKDPRVVMKY